MVRTVTQFKALYGTAGSLFPDNTTGEISEADVRAFGEDIADSFFNESDDSYISAFPQVTATGTNTYAATLAPAITAYATGQKFQIKFTNASSGVSTLNLNAVGAKKIFINPTTQATTGHIVAGQISLLAYDAALDSAAGGFLMLGAPSTSASTLAAVLAAGNNATGLQIKNLFNGSDPQDAVTLSQLAAAAVGLWDDRGTFDASVAAYPSSGGSGTAGAILKGDIWTISVAGTLPTGQVVEIGDTVRALTDTPGNTQANWAILQNNIGYVPQNIVNAAVTLTDAATIDLTAIKHTLTTALGRTFTISYTGDDITIEVTLSATSATQTFPAGSLCVTDGAETGDNTCPMSGVSGDKYIIAIKKIGSVYYVVCKNFGQ